MTFMKYANHSLKSNMDRFIDIAIDKEINNHIGLKSNMDRFIVPLSELKEFQLSEFKIQYG